MSETPAEPVTVTPHPWDREDYEAAIRQGWDDLLSRMENDVTHVLEAWQPKPDDAEAALKERLATICWLFNTRLGPR